MHIQNFLNLITSNRQHWMEASQFLAQHAGEARPFLGGTDIFVRMRDGFWHDKYLVDVKDLDGTNDLRFDPQAGLDRWARRST